MDVFINSAEAISSQNTFDTPEFLKKIENSDGDYFSVISPIYKKYINPKQLRRMSKVIRMGVACSTKVLETANIENPDAIIVGTGLGCLTDTLKFLDNMNENDESLLNPTPFIQSTHNTISGQIALLLSCKNYNFTFSQQTVSFETALLDAVIKLKEENINNVLLGGVDEITDKVNTLLQTLDCTKAKLNEFGKAFKYGEGASFFTLSKIKSDQNVARVKGLSNFNLSNSTSLPKGLSEVFIKENIKISDIDLIVSGALYNDEEEYHLVQKQFNKVPVLKYKHLAGEYDTVSAFAMWTAFRIIQNQEIPEVFSLKNIEAKSIQNILIHNYSHSHKHSFIVISKC